jgi:methylated-DNA-[protein]-cysteine S-methyltransferase
MTIEHQLTQLGGPLPPGISEGVALGTGLADGYDFYESPVGEVAVTFNLDGVSSLTLASEDWEGYFSMRHGRRLIRAEAPTAWSDRISPAIEAGTPGKLPVDLSSVTPFQAKILRIATKIPRGEARPYGWLAREANAPGAARAVGSTMARNPIPLIIPCHRVVRSDGTIGAYSLGGPEVKWDLLTHEGADPGHLEELAGNHIRVQGNRSTGIYCNPTCHALRRSKVENVVDFRSAGDAAKAGFRACEVCRP